jgi:hypothetical protein
VIVRSGRVAAPVIAIAVTLTVLIAGCGPSPATPSLGESPTGSLEPPATAEGPSSSAAGSGPTASPASPGAAVQVDAALLSFVPNAVDGVPLTFDPETSATIAADPSVAPDAASLAVGLAIVPGASAADDLAIVSIVKLRDPAKDDAWFRDWRDTYDQAACNPAGGLVGNAEAEIGGGTVYIGSCAGGVRTYHTRLAAAGIVVSITALGSRRLGEKVMAGLQR